MDAALEQPAPAVDPHREEVEVRITRVGEWKNEAMRYWSGDIELTEV